MDRVKLAQHLKEDGMTALMVCCDVFFLFGNDSCFLFRPDTDFNQCLLDFFHINFLLAVSGGQQRRFIQKVCQIRTGEACSCLRNHLQIHLRCHRLALCMHAQDGLSALYIGSADINLSVKTTGSEQCRVKDICTVGCRNDNNSLICSKTVHFNEQLVQSLFTFVVPTTKTCTSASADSINFVDKYNTGGVFLRLFKQIPYTGCTDTDKHFHEVGTGNAEKGYACLAGNCLCQQCLTGTRRAHQQHTLRDART